MASPVEATGADVRLASYEQRLALRDGSLFRNVPATNVGPTIMSGRLVDIDVSPFDPTHFYVAYASGGLWKTTNNGQSFVPLFDDQAVMTIGDIAVDWHHDEIIWVGTGENNSSRSSYFGTGVYKSMDLGESWTYVGLAETQHTGRIILHPDNPNTAWVAALGHLYSPNEERGVYRTENGGDTWTKTLFVNNSAGAIDLIADPKNADVLYAAIWERERRAWNFVEAGVGSGIHKSTDGGKTWTVISTPGSGLPVGEGLGRIGLDIYSGDETILYALVDNQNRRPEDEDDGDEEDSLERDDLRAMSATEFLALDSEMVSTYLRSNRFPEKYSTEKVTAMVRSGEIEPVALVEFVEDANQLLFNTPVHGAELYRSDDDGATWTKTHDDFINQVYNSYGYYFGEVRVSQFDSDRIYMLGVPLISSSDGGKTFESIGGPSVHADHQSMWVSPTREGHIIDGNDGGLNITYDNGENWYKANSPSVGQFYAIQVDNAEPYNVYGGLQDNGVWFGPNTYQASSSWHARGRYPYRSIMGGDGMQVEVDTRTNDVVYTGSQFGFYSRVNTSTGERISTRPRNELGERPLRFNWQTPVHLSRHQQDILYLGANKLYRSLNNGEDLKPISEDLTKGGQPGDVPFGTLATIDESPLRFGLIYVGSDDGLVHVTQNGGTNWSRISDSLPQDRWVSRVEASAHAEGRVYVSLNGYRSDNFEPLVYRSENYGETWEEIGTGLPAEPVNVVLEDPANEDVIYVGTDHATYVSTDRGATYQVLSDAIPFAPVHDLKIQEREGHLLVGTHGRSIYKVDLKHLRAVAKKDEASAVVIYDTESVRWSDRWGMRSAIWRDFFVPEVTLVVFSDEAGDATITVSDSTGTTLKEWSHQLDRGLNYLGYDLTAALNDLSRRARRNYDWEAADNDAVYLRAGDYTVTVARGGESGTNSLKIKAQDAR